MPWWGWLLTVLVALAVVYVGFAIYWAQKVGKRVFKAQDAVNKNIFGDKDPFDDPFFKRGGGRPLP